MDDANPVNGVISDGYHNLDGAWHPTSEHTRRRLQAAIGEPDVSNPMWFVAVGEAHGLNSSCELTLEDGTALGVVDHLPDTMPIGYHDLAPVDGGPVTRLVVHPTTCPPLPTAWGASAQVYALWDDTSWGIGDLGNVAALARRIADAGGGALLLSPLHQPAPSLPQQDSPYYPSTRRAWNPLLLAMGGAPPHRLRCDPGELIDRDAVWTAKRAVLWQQFDAFPVTSSDRSEGSADGATGTTGRPNPPSEIALWNARCERFGPRWQDWPATGTDGETATAMLDDPELLQVARFHDWVQALVGAQLAAAAAEGVALIGDLAVGFAPDGADACHYRSMVALDMRIGAPPDGFNSNGQEWGIPPFVPWKLRAARYQPFIDTIRAALCGVQGLRIDHVMGLFRQFWVPADGTPLDGAYVRFPASELLAIICLEATRAGAFVIGEDLGTVEPEVRSMLAACGIAGTRVAWFEPDPPGEWPLGCLATITTHDLPTIAGVFGRATDDPMRRCLEELAPGAADAAAAIAAAHSALRASPASLRLMTTDDLAGSTEQPNLPGTVGAPNWCRRLPLPVDQLLGPVQAAQPVEPDSIRQT